MLLSLFSPLSLPLLSSVSSLSWKQYWIFFSSVLFSCLTCILLFPFHCIVSSKFLCDSPSEFPRCCVADLSVSDTYVLGLFKIWFSLSLWLIPWASLILTLQEAFLVFPLFLPNWFSREKKLRYKFHYLFFWDTIVLGNVLPFHILLS